MNKERLEKMISSFNNKEDIIKLFVKLETEDRDPNIQKYVLNKDTLIMAQYICASMIKEVSKKDKPDEKFIVGYPKYDLKEIPSYNKDGTPSTNVLAALKPFNAERTQFAYWPIGNDYTEGWCVVTFIKESKKIKFFNNKEEALALLWR